MMTKNFKFFSILCWISLSVSSIKAQAGKDTIAFIHISDTHICRLEGYHSIIREKRNHYGSGVQPLETFLLTVPQQYRADFVTITGDLVDFYEGETPDGYMLKTQIQQFERLCRESPVPIYPVLGNHDIATYTMDGDRYRSNQLNSQKARAAWIRNLSVFQEGTYYSKTLKVGSTVYRLIFLDDGYYAQDRGREDPPFGMDPYQLDWLDSELKKSDTDIEIIFMHIPLIRPLPEEIQLTRNTYYHNEKDNKPIDYKLSFPDEIPFRLHKVLEQNASTRLIFTGHVHSSVIHRVNFEKSYSLTQVMTGAFGRDNRNWRLVRLTANEILVGAAGNTETILRIPTNRK